MKRKFLRRSTVVLAALLVAAPVSVYDQVKANEYAQMFASVIQALSSPGNEAELS